MSTRWAILLSLVVVLAGCYLNLSWESLPPRCEAQEAEMVKWAWPVYYPDNEYRSTRPGSCGDAAVPLARGAIVMYDTGRVELRIDGYEPRDMPKLRPPIPPLEIAYWSPSVLVRWDGQVWVHRESAKIEEWVKVE